MKPIFKILSITLLSLVAKQAHSLNITYNQTWNTSATYTEDIVIKPGVTLTINGGAVIKMNAGTYANAIIVESNLGLPGSGTGGRLVMNNATITTDDAWSGIHVVGEPTYKQSDNRMAQATLTNATIEKANYGLTNWNAKADFSNFTNKTGGILRASGTNFHNNMFGVWMQHYQNLNSAGNPTNDVSNFAGCTFSNDMVNPSFFGNGSLMRLHEVEGVRVSGCNFSDNRFGMFRGIWVEAAGVTVDFNCTAIDLSGNCISIASPSVFNNLSYAIYGGGQNGTHKVNVYNSTISNCTYGAYLFNYSLSTFLRNNITLNPGKSVAGISLDGCTGYRVEENQINGLSPSSSNITYGISISNSGTAYNELYLNYISNARYATQANGTNNNPTSSALGLTYLCNHMSNTVDDAYDIYVSPNATVNMFQGTPVSFNAAKNTFSAFNTVYTDHNFRNAANPLYYLYPTANPGLIPVQKSSNVTPIGVSDYGCPSKISNGGGAAAALASAANYATEKYALEANIETAAESDRNNLLSKYALLVQNKIRVESGYYNDDGDANPSEIISVLHDAKYNHEYQIQAACVEAEQGMYDAALITLENIPNNWVLNSDQIKELANLTDIIQIRKVLSDYGGDWTSVTDADKEVVGALAAGTDYAGYMARQMISQYDEVAYTPLLYNESSAATTAGRGTNALAEGNNSGKMQIVSIYPNPASDKVRVIGLSKNADITVTDITGKMILNGHITLDNPFVDVHQLAAGNYLLTVSQVNGTISHLKFSK